MSAQPRYACRAGDQCLRYVPSPYPCLCLWRGFSQITYTFPRRLTILHFGQRLRTEDVTFIGYELLCPSPAEVIRQSTHYTDHPGPRPELDPVPSALRARLWIRPRCVG